jgi:hypothetical protein
MNSGFSAPSAIFFEFYLALNFLFVLVGIIITPLANGALQGY